MRSTRGIGVAIFGFGMVVALVVGGLGWASVASLRLERERVLSQAREAQRVPLHLAMWRLDSLVKSILVREESRPYYHYAAYYYPGRVWWTASGQAMSPKILAASSRTRPFGSILKIRMIFALAESDLFDTRRRALRTVTRRSDCGFSPAR